MLSANITYFQFLLSQSISKYFANILNQRQSNNFNFFFFPSSVLGGIEDCICLIELELLMPKQLISRSEGYHIHLNLQERFRVDVVLNLYFTLSLWISYLLWEK